MNGAQHTTTCKIIQACNTAFAVSSTCLLQEKPFKNTKPTMNYFASGPKASFPHTDMHTHVHTCIHRVTHSAELQAQQAISVSQDLDRRLSLATSDLDASKQQLRALLAASERASELLNAREREDEEIRTADVDVAMKISELDSRVANLSRALSAVSGAYASEAVKVAAVRRKSNDDVKKLLKEIEKVAALERCVCVYACVYVVSHNCFITPQNQSAPSQMTMYMYVCELYDDVKILLKERENAAELERYVCMHVCMYGS
jgi:hypothetical protein